ncbi:hypothetical protein [Falsirhodobacter sp. alg1]|uniref:hypothetical protein n=1 Tax=Falsirhodobacter sp. alg1 TaxID=1472418 RepID=UPI0007881731|nr:hypothetical protein [Falsirhodobacter sp. alg1]
MDDRGKGFRIPDTPAWHGPTEKMMESGVLIRIEYDDWLIAYNTSQDLGLSAKAMHRILPDHPLNFEGWKAIILPPTTHLIGKILRELGHQASNLPTDLPDSMDDHCHGLQPQTPPEIASPKTRPLIKFHLHRLEAA